MAVRERSKTMEIARLGREEILLMARAQGHPVLSVFEAGAVDISPRHLVYWATFQHDADRDRFLGDAEIRKLFRDRMAALGYPEDFVPAIGITAESQETIDREFQGDWWAAIK